MLQGLRMAGWIFRYANISLRQSCPGDGAVSSPAWWKDFLENVGFWILQKLVLTLKMSFRSFVADFPTEGHCWSRHGFTEITLNSTADTESWWSKHQHTQMLSFGFKRQHLFQKSIHISIHSLISLAWRSLLHVECEEKQAQSTETFVDFRSLLMGYVF